MSDNHFEAALDVLFTASMKLITIATTESHQHQHGDGEDIAHAFCVLLGVASHDDIPMHIKEACITSHLDIGTAMESLLPTVVGYVKKDKKIRLEIYNLIKQNDWDKLTATDLKKFKATKTTSIDQKKAGAVLEAINTIGKSMLSTMKLPIAQRNPKVAQNLVKVAKKNLFLTFAEDGMKLSVVGDTLKDTLGTMEEHGITHPKKHAEKVLDDGYDIHKMWSAIYQELKVIETASGELPSKSKQLGHYGAVAKMYLEFIKLMYTYKQAQYESVRRILQKSAKELL